MKGEIPEWFYDEYKLEIQEYSIRPLDVENNKTRFWVRLSDALRLIEEKGA